MIKSARNIYLLLLLLIFTNSVICAQPVTPWPDMLRGFNVAVDLKENDIQDLAALQANVIRLSLPSQPLLDLEPPYALDETALAYLDSVISWCQKYGVSVIIDPHRYPGTEHQWTMLGSDPFWQDFKWHDHALRLWAHLAQHYQHHGNVIAGYDLLNEPSPPEDGSSGSPSDLSLLYQKLVDTIRTYDKKHAIILASPRVKVEDNRNSYIAGLDKITYPDDSLIVAEVHMYAPFEFSHQGVQDPKQDPVPYPTEIRGIQWNRKKLESLFEPAAHFSKSSGIPVFVGEFSCARWLGDTGNQYLKDIIEICEANQMSWTYHAFREASIWDPEKSNTSHTDDIRKAMTPRLRMLESFLERNK